MTWKKGDLHALFVLVDVDIEIVNNALWKAKEASSVSWFWLAEDSYEAAPQKRPKEDRKVNTGTEVPLKDGWSSSFVGWKVESVADWLKNMPDSVDLDGHHFAVIDRQTPEDGTIVVCKIGDKDLNGDKLDFDRLPPGEASNYLVGMEYGEWEELKEGSYDPEGTLRPKY